MATYQIQADRIPVLSYSVLGVIVLLFSWWAWEMVLPLSGALFVSSVLAMVTYGAYRFLCRAQSLLLIIVPTRWESVHVFHALASHGHRSRWALVEATCDLLALFSVPVPRAWQWRSLLSGGLLPAVCMSTLNTMLLVVPVLIVVAVLSAKGISLLQTVSTVDSGPMREWLGLAVEQREWLLSKLPASFADDVRVELDAIPLVTYSSQAGSLVLGFLLKASKGLLDLIMAALIAWVAMIAWYTRGEQLLRYLQHMLPFDDHHEERFFLEFRAMAKAIVWGTLFTALLQGGLNGALLYMVGLSWWLEASFLMVILAIIPMVGPNAVMIPAAIVLALGGDVGVGALVAVSGLIVGTVDNPIRARFASSFTKLDEWLILLSSVGGLFVYGPIGFMVGPIIWALLREALQIGGFEVREMQRRNQQVQKQVKAAARRAKWKACKQRYLNHPVDRMLGGEGVSWQSMKRRTGRCPR